MSCGTQCWPCCADDTLKFRVYACRFSAFLEQNRKEVEGVILNAEKEAKAKQDKVSGIVVAIQLQPPDVV